ncbi:MAG TPA: hypothetical protein VH186_32850 [Chloroflexia bacterium]|nr:hypothetical protein [Chloroflexia bacterium]
MAVPLLPYILGRDMDTDEPVPLADNQRPLGTLILGKTGTGKTSSALLPMIQRDIQVGNSFIVLDAHGDITERIIQFDPGDMDITFLSWDDALKENIGLNLYECPGEKTQRKIDRTVNNVVNVFKKVFKADQNFHPNIEWVTRQTAYTLVYNDLTMAEAPFLFGSPAYRNQLLEQVTNPQTHTFWQTYSTLRSYEKSQLVQPFITRIDPFLSNEVVYRCVANRKNTIPFQKILTKGGGLIITLPTDDTELVDFLGAVLLGVLSNEVWKLAERPPIDRRRCHVYLDEYSRFQSPSTRSFLTETRKYNIGVTIAHQYLGQIYEEIDRQAELNVGNLILFQLIPDDAERLVKGLNPPPVPGDPVLKPITVPKYEEQEVYTLPNKKLQAQFDEDLAWAKETIKKLHEKYDPLMAGWNAKLPSEYPPKKEEKTVEELIREADGEEPPSRPIDPRRINLDKVFMDSVMESAAYKQREEARKYKAEFERLMKEFENEYVRRSAVYGDKVKTERKPVYVGEEPQYEYNLINVDDPRHTGEKTRINERIQKQKYVPGPNRPIAEVRAELAQRLANLPIFHAYCKLTQHDGTLWEGEVIMPVPKTTPDVNMHMQRYKTESGSFYRIPWTRVSQDITTRQQLLVKTLQVQAPVVPKEEPQPQPLFVRSKRFYAE